MTKIMTIFGTRPEAIKMAPVILELNRRKAQGCPIEPMVCVTAQHRQMLDQVLSFFGIVPDIDLDIMTPGQDLSVLTGRILERVGEVLDRTTPDVVLVHGDTTTTFASALAACYRRILLGHVEAGLRTQDKHRPHPEELNRRLTGAVADMHFAPTQAARMNLLRENVMAENILVTGNTVIDALHHAVQSLGRRPLRFSRYGREFGQLDALDRTDRIILITGHRRESFGQGFENICLAIYDLALCWPDVHFVYPVHLNPHVLEPVHRIIGNRSNIHLLPPLDYEPFIALMSRSHLVLTDSGGIQEEAPSLGKPVIVMREVTERPEAVQAGTVRLAGTDRRKIFHEVDTLLSDGDAYEKMSFSHNPYGDGKAAGRIVDYLLYRSKIIPYSLAESSRQRHISPGEA
jgi:UDP-N-acetylglucosamine 2-epimerase (non-hydrolysing)